MKQSKIKLLKICKIKQVNLKSNRAWSKLRIKIYQRILLKNKQNIKLLSILSTICQTFHKITLLKQCNNGYTHKKIK